MRWFPVIGWTLLIVNFGMLSINLVLLGKFRRGNKQVRETLAQGRASLDEVEDARKRLQVMIDLQGVPPTPYTPGMTIEPGQSVVIEIPLPLPPPTDKLH